jgi:cell cycle sensor histidine kinase DivJ
VILSAPIRDFLEALVHPSARDDALTAERHLAFMVPRLFGSLIALGIFPVFLALRGVPSALELIVLAWMIVPIFTAYFLSRTGRYDDAQMLSALALTVIVTIVAANSGGINSFAAIWLVLIPLEAALSGSRRVVAAAALLAIGGVGLLILSDPWLDLASAGAHANGMLAGLGILSASLYATGIALGADSLARANSMRLGLEAEQCRLLAFSLTDVVSYHGHGGRITYASPNAQAVLGAPACELLGYGLFDRIHIADRPAYLRALSDAAATGETFEIEFRLRQHGQPGASAGAGLPPPEATRFIWIEMRCRPYGGGIGGERGASSPQVVASMRDVSTRKAGEAALVAARAEAERANAAKSRFLAVMSHELRTPLNAIIGFSDMLGNEAELRIDATRRGEYTRLINESGHHLLAVVNEILDMSRLEAGDFEITPEPVRVGAIIASCSELLALKAQEAGVTLKSDVPAGFPEIVADKRAVKQILINLMSNAIKFSDRGGTVTVAARVDGQHILLDVEDSGIGIAADDIARIGNPFFQVRGTYSRQQDGAGLGLSIVKGLVKLHGGDLEVESRPGEGTRMVVRLPLDCERAADAHRPIPFVGATPNSFAKGPPGGQSRTLHAADPSASQPAKVESPANLELPVQKRA